MKANTPRFPGKFKDAEFAKVQRSAYRWTCVLAMHGEQRGLSWKPITRAIAAAAFLLVHTSLAALFIVCMFGIQKLIASLWGVQEPLLFGRVPLAYVFHAIDLGV